MKKRVLIVGIVLLVSGLMVLPSTLFAGSNVATNKGKAYGDSGKILYIYGNDKMLADEWKDYLEGKDYEVELLPVDGLLNAQYKNYDLIIIGDDTLGMWNANYTEQIKMSRVPVLGIGGGGIDVFTKIGLDINFGNSMSITSDGSIYVPKKLTIYREPTDISGVPGSIGLYTSGALIHSIYAPTLDKNSSVCYAYDSNFSNHATIIEQDIYTYWGYVQSPTLLTSDGDILLSNLIYYIFNNFVAVPYLIMYVVMDGTGTYWLEWLDAKPISVGENYTYMKEDQDYLYFYLSVKNTSTNDFTLIWFETTNNRTIGTDVGCFYIILSESQNGVKVRKAQSYAPPGDWSGWGSFEDPDGVNISAAWNFGSSYLTAEVRILKSYLSATLGSSKYISFGAHAGNSNGISGRFPDTFYWLDATTTVTMVSRNHWYGHYMYIQSKYKKAKPTIDGHVGNDEWYSSEAYSLFTPNGNYSSIKVLHDNSAIYMGITITNTSGDESIYLYFDTNCDGGTLPHQDDLEIWGGESISGFYLSEHNGTGSGWGTTQPYSDEYAFGYSGTYLYFEIKIPFSKLGITAGEFKKIHMAIVIKYDSGGEFLRMPKNHAHLIPNTWTLVLYPADIWQTNRVDALDAPESLFSVNVDGQYNSDEWKDAFYYSIPLSNAKTLHLYIKNNGAYLYILARYYKPNPTNLTFINFYFDVGYNHSGGPQPDDYCLRVVYNGSMVEFQGTGGNWAKVTPIGWVGAAQNISNYWNVEIAVDLSKLGITPGDDTDLGFMIYIYDYSRISEHWPEAINSLDLSTYARLTSSNNWGNIPVMEINPLSILMISALVLAVATIGIRKKYVF